eukprot:2936070-Prorocentrum_lima.AAC.1
MTLPRPTRGPVVGPNSFRRSQDRVRRATGMFEDSSCLQQLRGAFSEARDQLLGPAHTRTHLAGPDRALRQT